MPDTKTPFPSGALSFSKHQRAQSNFLFIYSAPVKYAYMHNRKSYPENTGTPRISHFNPRIRSPPGSSLRPVPENPRVGGTGHLYLPAIPASKKAVFFLYDGSTSRGRSHHLETKIKSTERRQGEDHLPSRRQVIRGKKPEQLSSPPKREERVCRERRRTNRPSC